VAASFVFFGFHQEGGCGGSEGPNQCEQLLCAQDCINGTVTDADGCPTCECIPPPPSGCGSLDEQACLADTTCEAYYDDVDCGIAAPCAPDSDGCFRAPCMPSFAGCRERTGCGALDEAACNEHPECQPIYGGACPAAEGDVADPGLVAPPPCETGFLGCIDRDPCEGLDEQACLADPSCAPSYSEAVCTLECKPDPNDPTGCLPCDPVTIYDGCHSSAKCGVE